MLAAVALLFLASCSEAVYHGLGEQQANEMVVVLEQHGLSAEKSADPADDAAWVVSVSAAERVQAWQILQDEGLPRPETAGFSSFYPSGGLVPTASEERVLLQYSTAQELRKSLLAVDSVVDAQVNLVLPEKPRVRLEGSIIEPPRASVLVKYHPNQLLAESEPEAPLGEDAVRALIAGGVEGLDAEHVKVIFSRSMRTARPLKTPEMAAIGPVSVAYESRLKFQILVFSMGACILLLCAGLIMSVMRIRRTSKNGEKFTTDGQATI